MYSLEIETVIRFSTFSFFCFLLNAQHMIYFNQLLEIKSLHSKCYAKSSALTVWPFIVTASTGYGFVFLVKLTRAVPMALPVGTEKFCSPTLSADCRSRRRSGSRSRRVNTGGGEGFISGGSDGVNQLLWLDEHRDRASKLGLALTCEGHLTGFNLAVPVLRGESGRFGELFLVASP